MLKHRKARLGLILFSVLVTFLAIYLTVRSISFDEVYTSLRQSEWVFGIPIVLSYAVFLWVKAWRWQWLLHPVAAVPIRSLMAPMMIGFAGNNLLPARVGELIRMVVAGKVLKIPVMKVMPTVVLERVFDLFAVVLLLGVGLMLEGPADDQLIFLGYVGMLFAICFLMLCWLSAKYPARSLKWLSVCLKWFPEALQTKIITQATHALDGCAAITSLFSFLVIVFQSLLHWLIQAACIYFGFLSVGLDVPLQASLIVLASTAFAVAIPAAPGFFGTMQMAFLVGLSPYGVGSSEAVSASIYYHLIAYFMVVFSGLYYLNKLGLRLGKLSQEVRD